MFTTNLIDLGLSVKWCDRNVGASAIDDFGSYFSWGEVKPKVYYTIENCKYLRLNHNPRQDQVYYIIEKYNQTDNLYGFFDGKGKLEPRDDAATAILGYGFRTPTINELVELRENCTWKYSEIHSVKGVTATSKINGNSLFFPFTGRKDEPSESCMARSYIGVITGIWSSEVDSEDPMNAYLFGCGVHSSFSQVQRYLGYPIRGVEDK